MVELIHPFQIHHLQDDILAGVVSALAALAVTSPGEAASSRVDLAPIHARFPGLLAHLGGSAPLATAIARLCGAVEAQESVAALMTQIDVGPSELQIAVANALGQIGAIEAVEPLLTLTQGLKAAGVKKAAREAIARIQSQVSGAEAGQLSVLVAPEETGGLTMTHDREGGLVVAEEALVGSEVEAALEVTAAVVVEAEEA